MTSDKKKVAVILNKNARRYTGSLPVRIARIIPKRHIWVTGNPAEAEAAVGEILQEGFDCVFCGGGDGTIVTTITAMRRIVNSGKDYPIPPLGILKMGTGNAWAYAVGMKAGLGQLDRVVRGGYYSLAPFPLIRVKDLLCPIAGVGWDAQVLNDYYELTDGFNHTPFAPLIRNLFGYFVAAGTRTIPRFLQGDSLTEVKITFIGRRLLKPDTKGNFFPITDRDDSVIYQGPASIVAAGTIPFFGYKMRVFPFAGKVPGTMHLRIANLDVRDAIEHLRGFWAGTYFSHKIIDYITDGVRLTFEKDEPIEAGGDPMGYTRSVDFTVPDFSVNIIAFWGI